MGMGVVHFFDGDLETSKEYFEKTIHPLSNTNLDGLAITKTFLGNIARLEGKQDEAESLLNEAILIFHEVGDMRAIAQALIFLGRLQLDNVNLTAARRCFNEAIFLASESHSWNYIPWSLEALACNFSAMHQFYDAAKLLGASALLREKLGTPLLPIELRDYEACKAAIHAQIDDPSFESAWAEGFAMSREQMVEYALKISM
jgi:tetratricopeptide (TPR) repeat protein